MIGVDLVNLLKQLNGFCTRALEAAAGLCVARGHYEVAIEHFLRQACRRARRAVPAVAADALQLLQTYPWPGNVREMENELERAVALADNGRPLGPVHLSERIAAGAGAVAAVPTLNEAVEALKRRMIEDALLRVRRIELEERD